MINIFLHLFVLKLLYGQNKFPPQENTHEIPVHGIRGIQKRSIFPQPAPCKLIQEVLLDIEANTDTKAKVDKGQKWKN